MGKVKCYSVRVKSLTLISEKCAKVESFDGSTDLIPTSQIFGVDYDVEKSSAYWISAWILERKNIQYSTKKIGYFDTYSGAISSPVHIEHHVPEQLTADNSEPIEDLIK